MPYVFNLKSKTLAPMPSHPGADPKEFISKNAIVVTDEQAHMIGKADSEELERITTQILGKRLLRDQGMTAEHRKILEAGMAALGIDDLSEVTKDKPKVTKDKPKVEDKVEEEAEEEVEDEPLSMTLDTGNSSALLSKAQVLKIKKHATILKYAREVLGLDVLDNETFEVLKRKVLARQFGEEA